MVEDVVSVDQSKRIVFENKAAGSLLEFERREVMERPLLEIARNTSVHEMGVETFTGEGRHLTEFEILGKTCRIVAVHGTRLSGTPCLEAVLVFLSHGVVTAGEPAPRVCCKCVA